MVDQVDLRVKLSNTGFTLVEVLVSMLIILLAMMGLVQASLLVVDVNLKNLLRDEAVRIAEQRMYGMLTDKGNILYHGLRNMPFDDTALAQTDWTCTASDVSRNVRNMKKDFLVCWKITNIKRVPADTTIDIKRLDVAVGWDMKQEGPTLTPTRREFQHSISSVLRRPL